ncbi:MAG TPA: DNA recombination protein RmuC [Patescibacteria group bacterium]|jgi:DNA recombination protein RmuC|nr:DNA recombination protein RmuC [Patescibacteria group bacterium]
MNQINPYVILAVLVAGFGAVIYFQTRKREEPKKDDETLKVMMEWMKEIKAGTESTKQSMEKEIKETNKAISERLDAAGRYIADLKKELGGVSQIGPDLRRLSETLASPKMRGNFGEEVLENMLNQVFPKELTTYQYRFKNGEVVDAIVRIGTLILPIDSKFSMENYRLYKEAKTDESIEDQKKLFLKDIKKRIDEIHKKYILPQEGTYDFALMFIPSEGIYIEVAEDLPTCAYARDKKVVLVGPNSLYLTLQTFLVSLRGQQINKAAQQVLSMISGIKQESDKFSKTLDTMANHVKNTNNTMGTVVDGYSKLKGQILNASNLQLGDSKVEELPEVGVDKLV